VNSMVPAPPPRARPAAPPAPPIPRGQGFKPQWDELKDFSESDTIVSAECVVPIPGVVCVQLLWNASIGKYAAGWG
jgi:hypothetical protein